MESSGKKEKRIRNNFSADEDERLAQFFARNPQHPRKSKNTYETLLQEEWARYHPVSSWLGRYMRFERNYEARIAEIIANGGGMAQGQSDDSGRESSNEAERSVERPNKRRRRNLHLESEPDSDEATGSFTQFPVLLNSFIGKTMSQTDQYLGLNLAITHLSVTHGFPTAVVYATWELTGSLYLADELLRRTKLSLGGISHDDRGSGEPSASRRVHRQNSWSETREKPSSSPGRARKRRRRGISNEQSVDNVHSNAGRYPEPVPQSQLCLPPHGHLLPPPGREISADFAPSSMPWQDDEVPMQEAYRLARRVPTAQESVVPETPQVSERGDSPPPPLGPQEAHDSSSSESGDTSASESSSSSSSSSFYGSQYQEPAAESIYITTQTSLFGIELPEAPVVSYVSSNYKNRKAAQVSTDSRMYHVARRYREAGHTVPYRRDN
ncbi:hypothetical protein C8J57DRAFT_1600560 [Mycena rebaudengoi]|nr:hypothetical protein C8J57DRAFT_1600560 [Mycena rebaudengoi]